ncbi:hypothetical protein H4582DRAFT_2133982 [Lactarius indigo]|nr:hypothetical protein H4582DRAFT_2133982 [Lactarius indigo]
MRRAITNDLIKQKEKAQLSIYRSPPMTWSPFTGSEDHVMSIVVYAGGKSNGSPSVEVKPGLNLVTLMLALLALNTPDPCGIFVVRMLRDPPAGAEGNGWEWWRYRSILKKAVIMEAREFFDLVAGKSGHETRATAMTPNASLRAGMLECHRSTSGVVSEVCRKDVASADEREVEEGRRFEDNTPRDESEGFPSSRK